MEIKDYLGETTLYEKKEKVEKNKVKNCLKTVSAFANGKGGMDLIKLPEEWKHLMILK